jgi:hypothetical protein
MARAIVEARAAGRLGSDASTGAGTGPSTDELRQSLAPVAEGLSLDMPVPMVVRFVQAWATVVGIISLEIFGHWRNTILDPEAFFEAAVRNLAADLGLA